MKKKVFFLSAFIFSCFAGIGNPYHATDGCTQNPSDNSIMIRSNLYWVQNDGTTTLLDGDMTQYREDFSNNLDSLDIKKMSNFSENLGELRDSRTLVVERRTTITDADTIFFKLWNTHQRNYQFQFIATNLEQPGLSAYLDDSYLGTKTPVDLNDSTYINFFINSDPASANPYRFRIIFGRALSLLPVIISSFTAQQENSVINLNWKSENGADVDKFIVQKSNNGLDFQSIGIVKDNNLSSRYFHWKDDSPVTRDIYYRIQTFQTNGKWEYTQVIRVKPTDELNEISVYPNPVIGNVINLKMMRQPEGIYTIQLINSFGQRLQVQSFLFSGNGQKQIRLNGSIPKGLYHLLIIKPSGEAESIGLIL